MTFAALPRLARHFSLLALAASLIGCGYSQPADYEKAPAGGGYDKPTASGYQWHSLYREDVQTVAVPIFTTRDYNRGIEFRLSKSVVHNIEAHSQYKVVGREHADTVLEGEILNSRVDNLSRDYFTNIPQEQLVVITVNFRWKDLRTGRILVDGRTSSRPPAITPPPERTSGSATNWPSSGWRWASSKSCRRTGRSLSALAPSPPGRGLG